MINSARVGALVLLAIAAVGCHEKLGPSLAVDVQETGSPVATGSTSSICCCKLSGVALNRSSVPVHVTLRWNAFDRQGNTIGGAAAAFVENVPAGGQKAFTATPFLDACANIARHELTRKDIVGLWEPTR